VLRKDFLVDPYQVAEARAHGADAVLLIVALLKGTRLREMLAVVHAYGLEALVEVHDEPELEEAVNAGAEVIGINNRDLRTFTVDLATSERLVPMIPASRTIVAESGIHTPDDLRRLAAAGAHAVLVGESLMKAADRQATLRGLIQ
jgi:indole-3-glycerol phosphate synthase